MNQFKENKQHNPSLFRPTEQFSDVDLIMGIQEGSAAAASAFHQRFGKRISRLVWSLLGGDAEHGDVVNSIFVNIIESIGTISDPSRLAAWVDSVTFRVTRKELRRRKLRRQIQLDIGISDLSRDFQSLETTVVAKRFYCVMDRMEPEDRMLFIVKYFENFGLDEISQMTGWSLSTTRRRIKRAESSFEKIAQQDIFLKSKLGRVGDAD